MIARACVRRSSQLFRLARSFKPAFAKQRRRITQCAAQLHVGQCGLRILVKRFAAQVIHLRLRGQQFSQVHDADTRSISRKTPADLHQTTRVARYDSLHARTLDRFDLLIEDRH